ncbi:TIGR02594 family protein [uncultured Roseobacter sp.]|uniref:NlpC/P60 family protein n=1 Tax=uncultured Roseobacter sp. TaxID=114847 RepID=UPI00260A92C3|nr:TIGR02594 family protein [uncultured Roseobacter sp.]
MTYDVRAIQARLAELGFDPGPIDGIDGPQTQAAVIAFKKSVGLRARAYVGPITWAALMEDAPDSEIPWMSEAIRVKGLHEARNRSQLVRWFDASVSWFDPREVPWCGAFVATVMRKWKPGITLPENPLGARNWDDFGKSCAPQLGAVMVFWRGSRNGWKGHVGLYWGEDADAYHILGGNQSNAVTITRISKARFLDARWPFDTRQPSITKHLNKNGQPLSVNEA